MTLRSHIALALCVVVLFIGMPMPPAVHAAAGDRDYPSGSAIRPNGHDLDDDGIAGEAGTDDTICDEVGGSASSNYYTEDYDGDAVTEDQIFVDADSGTDNTTCGLPGTPCATINYALGRIAGTNGTAAPSAGESAICARGTDDTDFSAALDNTFDGSGTTTHAIGFFGEDQDVAITVSSDPFVITGWDADNDGIYPPLDTDDTPYTHNDTTGYAMVIDVTDGVSHIHMSHLVFYESGHDSMANGGFVDMGSGTLGAGVGEYWRLSDLKLERTNYQGCHTTGKIVFSHFGWKFSNFAAHNIDLVDAYGYVWRGGIEGKNNAWFNNDMQLRAIGGSSGTATADHLGNNCWDGTVSPGSNGGGVMTRWWGEDSVSGDYALHVFSNTGRLSGYDNAPGSGGGVGLFTLLSCLQGITVSGNLALDIAGAFAMFNVSDGICDQQGTANMTFERNVQDLDGTRSDFESGENVPFGFLNGNDNADVDDLTGTFRIAETCISLVEGNGLSAGSFFSYDPRDDVDASAFTIEIVNNDIDLSHSPGSPALFFREQITGTTPIPSSLVFDGNRARVGTEDGDEQFQMTETGWQTAYADTNDDNVFPFSNWELPGGVDTAIADMRTNLGGDANSVVDNTTTITCDVHADGTDYSAGAGGTVNSYTFLRSP